MNLIFESRKVGDRAATRVRIVAPTGSRFDNKVGVVVARIADRTYLIRFADGLELPFGRSEFVKDGTG